MSLWMDWHGEYPLCMTRHTPLQVSSLKCTCTISVHANISSYADFSRVPSIAGDLVKCNVWFLVYVNLYSPLWFWHEVTFWKWRVMCKMHQNKTRTIWTFTDFFFSYNDKWLFLTMICDSCMEPMRLHITSCSSNFY